jgi:hypothetical protein
MIGTATVGSKPTIQEITIMGVEVVELPYKFYFNFLIISIFIIIG